MKVEQHIIPGTDKQVPSCISLLCTIIKYVIKNYKKVKSFCWPFLFICAYVCQLQIEKTHYKLSSLLTWWLPVRRYIIQEIMQSAQGGTY